MITVYTSNYSKYKGDRCVQISASAPLWAKPYKKIEELYPTWPMINSIKDNPGNKEIEEIYTNNYIKLIAPEIDKIISQLEDGDVLCCWCGEGMFCHRHLLKKILKAFDIECLEL